MNRIKPSSKRWGIVAGVDKYENANEYLRNLKGCVIDAHKMYDTMMNQDCCGFLENHVRLLENPRLDDLEEAFADVGTRMCVGDELWFYFAGHGYSDKKRKRDNGYLLLSGAKYDTRGFLRSEGSMSRDQLADIVGQHIKAGGVTVVSFLDCCCAASVGLAAGDRAVQETTELEDIATSFGAMPVRDLNLVSHDDCSEPMQFMSLCATGKYGRAHEDENGGAFTRRLVEGLMGGTSAHPTAFEDIYVTAGALGLYVGARMAEQGPKQNIADPMYPLSVSPDKKRIQDQIRALDGNVRKWLENFTGCVDDKQFAERVLVRAEDFEFAGIMRNVLRLVSDPNCTMKVGGEDAANLLKAFHVLKKLLDKASEGGLYDAHVASGHANLHPKRPVATPSAQDSPADKVPLTSHDRELLADVEDRLRDVDSEETDLSDLARKSQTGAAVALDMMARTRMRQMCGRARYAPLFLKNERDAWSMKARKGFSSAFEAAVYELVKDDKALAVRGR